MNSDGGVERIDLEKVDWRGSREFFESLGDALDKLDDHDESYDFTWVGKRKSIIEAGAPISKTLRPDVENSKNWDTTENLFIEGDNLDALKLLQESYLGKVKMIYIDPPYNTGKDFVYHDNFKADTEQYDEDTEYKDDEGNIQFKKNEKTNGRYHSDWLSMMYPRLKLARNLLSDDGVIFISIDDNEQANLKKLCDEVFGEDNFVADFIVVRSEGGGLAKQAVIGHDYLLAYAKNIDSFTPLGRPKDIRGKIVVINDEEFWIETDWLRKEFGKYGTCRYEEIVEFKGVEKKLEIDEGIKRGEYVLIKQIDGRHIVGRYRKVGNDTSKFYTILKHLNKNGVADLEGIGLDKFFDFPKPTSLLKEIILGATIHTKDSLVLDFFSGSATSAHAVMQLNAEDGGNRKWIMVQLPEETDEKSEAHKAGYKTIPEISRERIRRAGDKIASEHPDAKVDYGFRALRIDETNHKDVYRPAADYQQNMLDDLVDNIKEDRSDLDLLYGVLTATAWELNKPLETVTLDGATVYKYDYFGEVSGLVACFADEISEEAIKQIAQLKPLTAVFKEGSFPNSQAKVNLAEHFRIISPDTKVKVI